jgi:hypothetical protein
MTIPPLPRRRWVALVFRYVTNQPTKTNQRHNTVPCKNLHTKAHFDMGLVGFLHGIYMAACYTVDG